MQNEAIEEQTPALDGCLAASPICGLPAPAGGQDAYWEKSTAEEEMSLEHKIRAIAGTFILVSLALGWWVSPWWFLFTAFVGLNLLQSAFTKWCLMEDILKWLAARWEQPAAGA